MKSIRISLLPLALILGLSVIFLSFGHANSSLSDIFHGSGFAEDLQKPAAPQQLPLQFPPGRPWFAQEEISLNPDPPIPGSPVEICAEIINVDFDSPHTGLLSFGVAPLGIGVPFNPVGEKTIVVPPGGKATGCIVTIAPGSGQWGIEALLSQESSQEILRSLRNIDRWEPLVPGEAHDLVFQVGPLGAEGQLVFSLVKYNPEWVISIDPNQINVTNPDQVYAVTLRTIPPQGVILGSQLPIVDVEGYLNGQSVGGFRKIDSSPVPLHMPADPPYAEREITITPYPPLAGEPTEICVELRNPTPDAQDVVVNFAWASFGIGLPWTPIDGPRPVHLPPYSVVKECIHWVPPISGHVCLQVTLEAQGYETQRSQRNLDVNEPLVPGEGDSLVFPVGNPLERPAAITLGLIPHVDGWGFELSQDVLPDMQPGAVQPVTLTVTPPAGQDLPPDGTVIVDVEAYAEGELVGGFRKVFRPPVPIHQPKDPIYAESEIFINPYPPRAGEPTQIVVEVRNPTDVPQTVTVTFKVGNFGIGLPFNPMNVVPGVVIPPHGAIPVSTVWVPPFGGLFCVQVELNLAGYKLPFISQRNIDVGEPLEPLTPHARTFLVGNPLQQEATIVLGIVPHLPDWSFELSQDVLPNIQPGETVPVTLTVTPPANLPPDGTPIVDIEAFVNGQLIGGFRKIFRPPVPIHQPKDPVYAESEIGVDPYPALPGQPTMLSVEVFNPTDDDHIVTATFSIAPFGIGLPFDTSNIAPNPIQIYVPAHGAARGHVVWTPPDWQGKFCVKVTLQMDGHEPVWSQRNIDVGEPLEPGVPHQLTFPVGSGDNTQEVDIALGSILHKEDWKVSLSDDVLQDVKPGEQRLVTLTVTPPVNAVLGTGEPIVDVEAYVEGELLGGIRKLDVPPIPIHKPHEKGYSESEIIIDPYPPRQGEVSTVSTLVQNTSDVEVTVNLEFGWADFGMGIPFSTDGMVPSSRTVTLGPGMTATPSVAWTPTMTGHQCVIVNLTDPEGIYEPQRSQRNVDVLERPACGVTKTYAFTIANPTPLTVTVDIGLITFNVPPDWIITTSPSGSVEIEPNGSLVVQVQVTIPCANSPQEALDRQMVDSLQETAGGLPIIDVEGYIEGELVGGIELQFTNETVYDMYMPVIRRH